MANVRSLFLFVASTLIILVFTLTLLAAYEPKLVDDIWPYDSPGYATRLFVGLAPAALSTGARWPEWATTRDKENLRRATHAMMEGQSRKFIATLMVLQDELEERDHEALDLKRMMIGELAGTVIATSLIPLVFASLYTLALLLLSTILSRTWINPVDWMETGGAWLFGIAGVWLFRLLFGTILLGVMIGAGVALAQYSRLLFGFTEVLAWLNLLLFIMWIMALVGIGVIPRPFLITCPRCSGVGKVERLPARKGPMISDEV